MAGLVLSVASSPNVCSLRLNGLNEGGSAAVVKFPAGSTSAPVRKVGVVDPFGAAWIVTSDPGVKPVPAIGMFLTPAS